MAPRDQRPDTFQDISSYAADHRRQSNHRWGFPYPTRIDDEEMTYGSAGFYLDIGTMNVFGGRSAYGPPPEVYVGWTSHQDHAFTDQADSRCGSQIHEFGLFAIEAGDTRYMSVAEMVRTGRLELRPPVRSPVERGSSGEATGGRDTPGNNQWMDTVNLYHDEIRSVLDELSRHPWPAAAGRDYSGTPYDTPARSIAFRPVFPARAANNADLAPASVSGRRVTPQINCSEERRSFPPGSWWPYNPVIESVNLPLHIALGLVEMRWAKIEPEIRTWPYRGRLLFLGDALSCAIGFMKHSGSAPWSSSWASSALSAVSARIPASLSAPPISLPGPQILFEISANSQPFTALYRAVGALGEEIHSSQWYSLQQRVAPHSLADGMPLARRTFLHSMFIADVVGAYSLSAMICNRIQRALPMDPGENRHKAVASTVRFLQKFEVGRNIAMKNREALIRGCMRVRSSAGRIDWLGPFENISSELRPGGETSGWPFYRHEERYSAAVDRLPTDPLRLGRLEWFSLAIKVTRGGSSHPTQTNSGEGARADVYSLLHDLQLDSFVPSSVTVTLLDWSEFLRILEDDMNRFHIEVASRAARSTPEPSFAAPAWIR